MDITPEIINVISASFSPNKPPKTVKTRPCRIKFNGEFITTTSKKTVWRNKGFAKSALLNHLESYEIKTAIFGTRYPGHDAIKKLRDELERLGLIKYVEVDIEDFAVTKD